MSTRGLKYDNFYPLIAIVVTLIINIALGFFWGGKTTSDIVNTQKSVNDLSETVKEFHADWKLTHETDIQAMNKIESHVCVLDTINKLECISTQ